MRPALAALRGSRPSLSAAARTAAAQAGLGRAAAPPTRPCPSRKTPRSHRFLSTSTTPTSVTKGGTSPTSSLATPWLPTRTHYAGDLRSSHEGEEVILAGWVVQSRKPSAVLSFHPLRDSTGQVQLVMDAPNGEDKTLMSLPRESVIHVKGIVRRRPAEGVRLLDDPTGAVEVLIKEWHLLNPASSSLPFHPSDEYKMPNDDFRSKHRHLDLRRPVMTENIRLRSRVAHRMRCHLHDEGFTEIETPLLLRSTPEGAREFLVPTRVPAGSPPSFYALPQSPQQPKQLLIASGVTDKYFQIAKCFRDEAGRKDRQPEFTQLDLEMGFVDGCPRHEAGEWRIGGEQVRRTIEGLIGSVWREAKNEGVLPSGGFRVMTYDEAMRTFGSDKPDVRFGMKIVDLGPYISSSDGESWDCEGGSGAKQTVEILAFRVPKKGKDEVNVTAAGHSPQGQKSQNRNKAKAPTPSSNTAVGFSNKDMAELVKDESGSDAATPHLERFKSPNSSPHSLANLLLQKSSHLRAHLQRHSIDAQDVDAEKLADGVRVAIEQSAWNNDGKDDADYEEETHLFVSSRRDPPVGASTALGNLRLRLRDAVVSKSLATLPTSPHFLWVTEFPLFTQSDEEKATLTGRGRWASTHHPFTAPAHTSMREVEDILTRLQNGAEITHLASALENIKGQHYDLVLNGLEIGGGSVRIHSAALQRHVFTHILQLSGDEMARFDHLLAALDSGCPPHGGIALGFDRLMTFLTRTECKSIRDVIAFPKSTGGKDMLFGSPAGFEDEKERREVRREWGMEGDTI